MIEREIAGQLDRHLQRKEMCLVVGPRQAGKTTILLALKKKLQDRGEPTIYFNLDRLEDAETFATQKTLLERIRFECGEKSGYVFIDEIHRLKNAGIFLKGLYDYLTPYKFFVTGSGSLELKEDIAEPLTGRKRLFYLFPCSFAEFFRYRTNRPIDSFNRYCQANRDDTIRLIDEYLVWGGYPAVITAKTQTEKRETLEEIHQSYIQKDVKALLGVEKDFSYQYLMRYLASETGSLLNKTEIARNLTLNIRTLDRYLFLLEKTFIIKIIRPFFRNPTKELTKTPKTYFLDAGLRNSILQKFEPSSRRDDRGRLFETFVFRQLIDRNPNRDVWFWRSELGAEVDFVLMEKDIIPIEAKAGDERIGVTGRGLLSFMDKNSVKTGYIVHSGNSGKTIKQGKTIIYKSFLF